MANEEKGFSQTEGGEEDIDDFIAVKFGGKKFLDTKCQVALDFLCGLSIISPCRTYRSSS
ncbi:hypothetical protein FACS18942_10030 [Planctomycetales bacterium]|nr:hypothetical protein FACS1894189_7400 [Planctomycetales bacterium]GHT29096.1 hypothetical protein FACS18942_10030 [Planctomycetales bacterium]GHT38130.1 hypothetical protein FACS189427_12010 [Planctomycetales bacterium]